MNPLTVILITVLPTRDRRIRALVERLCGDQGRFVSAQSLARSVGWHNRYELYRSLHANRLPPLTELARWIRALGWTLDSEQNGRTLCAGALAAGDDPAVRYRLIHQLTGTLWSELAEAGVGWLTYRFLDRIYGGSDKAARRVSTYPPEAEEEGRKEGRKKDCYGLTPDGARRTA